MKALITAGGRGQRLYPLTTVTRKEFLPVPGPGGLLVPLLVKHLVDLAEAGFSDVGVVINPAEASLFRRLLQGPSSREVPRLSDAQRMIAETIRLVAPSVTLIPQESPEGLGHAILSASQWLGEEDFMLVLGDHYLVAHRGAEGCIRQLGSYLPLAPDRAAVLGIIRTPEAEVGRFGCVGGDWLGAGELVIRDLIEKPDAATARARLRVRGLGDSEFLSLFGIYILSGGILEQLRLDARARAGSEELQLTPSLAGLLSAREGIGRLIEGRRLDIGVQSDYRAALCDAPQGPAADVGPGAAGRETSGGIRGRA